MSMTNTVEQLFVEKLRSLLKFGTISRRYKKRYGKGKGEDENQKRSDKGDGGTFAVKERYGKQEI